MKNYLLGWLSPTGDFIKSDEGEHGDTARELLVKLGVAEEKTWDPYFYVSEYLIYYYNYALIHMPEFGFNYLHLEYHLLSATQKAFLEKYKTENNIEFIENKITKRMAKRGY